MRDGIASPLDGLQSPFGSRGTSLAALIRALFRDGEAGAWIDPSDSTTLFQDAAGTTPAGIGDPARLVLDKSGNDNDALAPSDAARPVYGRVPVTGRRNLLTRTEEFDNSVWMKSSASITANAATAPDGTLTADEITHSSQYANVTQGVSYPAGTYTASFWVRANTGTNPLFISYFDGAFRTGTSITPSADWARHTWTFTAASPITQIVIAQDRAESGFGSHFIWGAQLELGSTATPYQRVGSTFDVTEAGVASAIYLRRDLTDDKFEVTLPAITDGKIIIGTTQGVWIDDLTFAGGTFSLGPTTYTGGPAGLYEAIGDDELGTIILDRQPTASELATIMKWFESKGSPDNLITEPF